MSDDLTARLAFVLEADALKTVLRRNPINRGERRENTAEHSWHLALMAVVLAPHADDPVDVGRVVTMLLVHDLVEIDAGDTFAYDEVGYETKVERELAAAERIFGLLPAEQGAELRALWDEFESNDTADARFARAVDRLQPLMLNHAARGGVWADAAITAERVRARNAPIADASGELWERAQALIDDAVANGWISSEPPVA